MTLTVGLSFDEEYRRRLRDGRLEVQKCPAGHAVFPPRPACPSCGDRELIWVPSAGQGLIYSATTLFPRDAPEYLIVIVEMDEGFRMMSRIDGPDVKAARIGDRVRAVIRPVAEGEDPVPCFELVTGETSEAVDAH